MVYVGVLAELLGIEPAEIEAALLHHFEGKEKAAGLNMEMVESAIDWPPIMLWRTTAIALNG